MVGKAGSPLGQSVNLWWLTAAAYATVVAGLIALDAEQRQGLETIHAAPSHTSVALGIALPVVALVAMVRPAAYLWGLLCAVMSGAGSLAVIAGPNSGPPASAELFALVVLLITCMVREPRPRVIAVIVALSACLLVGSGALLSVSTSQPDARPIDAHLARPRVGVYWSGRRPDRRLVRGGDPSTAG